MLLNAETEVAAGREVLFLELELLDGETLLEDLLSLVTADSHVAGDFLVSADAESADGQASLAEDRLLIGKLGEHL